MITRTSYFALATVLFTVSSVPVYAQAPQAVPDAVHLAADETAVAPSALQADGSYLLSVKAGGGFAPQILEVPAGQKIKVVVKNDDQTEAEFESYTLKREEKVAPGANTEVFLGPLEAGKYEFFDDNNPDAKGVLIAK